MHAITETFLSNNIYSGIQYKCLNYIKNTLSVKELVGLLFWRIEALGCAQSLQISNHKLNFFYF